MAPVAVVGLVIIGATAAGATTILKVAVLVPAVFEAVSVALVVPATVGVPVIAPVRTLSVRPAGRPVAV